MVQVSSEFVFKLLKLFHLSYAAGGFNLCGLLPAYDHPMIVKLSFVNFVRGTRTIFCSPLGYRVENLDISDP